MSIARVRELAAEMSQATTPVVCSFTHGQLVDLLAEIDMRAKPAAVAPAPAIPQPTNDLAAVVQYASHRRTCEHCSRGNRCDVGQPLYAAACAAVLDQTRILL